MRSFFIALTVVLAGVGAARAEALQIVVNNSSPFLIKEFYASPVGTYAWGRDLFGMDYVPGGSRFTVTIDDTHNRCIYDLRFVMGDDSDFIDKGINLCAVSEYTLSQTR